MLRKIIFKDTKKQEELVLPITPESFRVSSGIKTETVSLYMLGDINLPGLPTLANIQIGCQFPNQDYAFSLPVYGSPYQYINTIKTWIKERAILRFVVSGTGINLPVYIENVEYGEQDGTNDVYAELSIREYRQPVVEKLVATSSYQPIQRTTEERANTQSITYTILYGDTMWAIARKYYGNPQLCWKLAAFNNIPNANIIMAGQIITIPPREALG